MSIIGSSVAYVRKFSKKVGSNDNQQVIISTPAHLIGHCWLEYIIGHSYVLFGLAHVKEAKFHIFLLSLGKIYLGRRERAKSSRPNSQPYYYWPNSYGQSEEFIRVQFSCGKERTIPRQSASPVLLDRIGNHHAIKTYCLSHTVGSRSKRHLIIKLLVSIRFSHYFCLKFNCSSLPWKSISWVGPSRNLKKNRKPFSELAQETIMLKEIYN